MQSWDEFVSDHMEGDAVTTPDDAPDDDGKRKAVEREPRGNADLDALEGGSIASRVPLFPGDLVLVQLPEGLPPEIAMTLVEHLQAWAANTGVTPVVFGESVKVEILTPPFQGDVS